MTDRKYSSWANMDFVIRNKLGFDPNIISDDEMDRDVQCPII